MNNEATVRVLLVGDGLMSFDRSTYFSIADVVEILRSMRAPVRAEVTTKHRQNDDFRFRPGSLDGYDEVWLFGFNRIGADELSSAELAVVTRYMNAGGGVFATGDHEDLGAAMCRAIPRIRSMRAWDWPSAQPGYPVAPHGSDRSRHDTLRVSSDGDGRFWFENESDARPQAIEVVRFPAPVGPFVPHPLLVGPHGVIDGIADHAHEGECHFPSDVTRRYEFGDVRGDEYPLNPAGVRITPVRIGYATVIGGHTTDNKYGGGPVKPAVAGRRYAVACAYNGHAARVGRVAVDATWHHFLDINLTGRRDLPPSDVRHRGFRHPSADPRTLEQIAAYFRNLVWWLAPAAKQQELLGTSLQWALSAYPLAEELRPGDDPGDVDTAIAIGRSARATLGENAVHVLAALTERLDNDEVNPWRDTETEYAEDVQPSSPFLDTSRIPDLILGGGVLGIARGEAEIVAGARTALAQLPDALDRATGTLRTFRR